MRATLFSWDSNPAVDKAYRLNFNQILDHVRAGRAHKINQVDHNGQHCYQMRPPVSSCSVVERGQEDLVGGGGYGSAWKIIPSDNVPVWQMPSVRSAVTA